MENSASDQKRLFQRGKKSSVLCLPMLSAWAVLANSCLLGSLTLRQFFSMWCLSWWYMQTTHPFWPQLPQKSNLGIITKFILDCLTCKWFLLGSKITKCDPGDGFLRSSCDPVQAPAVEDLAVAVREALCSRLGGRSAGTWFKLLSFPNYQYAQGKFSASSS